MTPEELAEIKAHHATGVDADLIQQLVAEVERLRAIVDLAIEYPEDWTLKVVSAWIDSVRKGNGC